MSQKTECTSPYLRPLKNFSELKSYTPHLQRKGRISIPTFLNSIVPIYYLPFPLEFSFADLCSMLERCGYRGVVLLLIVKQYYNNINVILYNIYIYISLPSSFAPLFHWKVLVNSDTVFKMVVIIILPTYWKRPFLSGSNALD